MRVLLIEDEQRVSSFVKKGLEEQGIQVMQAFDGPTGLSLARQQDFDVIVLDVIMPGMNGFEVCAQLRKVEKDFTPILMLTALGTTEDVVEGLDSGADDYLVKPFKFRELLARIHALARRRMPRTRKFCVRDLEMDTEAKEVRRGNQKIDLTAREFRLLEYLMQSKNRIVSKADILENVWDVNHDLGTNVVEVYINYLRKKIDHGEESMIKTVKGMGYTMQE